VEKISLMIKEKKYILQGIKLFRKKRISFVEEAIFSFFTYLFNLESPSFEIVSPYFQYSLQD